MVPEAAEISGDLEQLRRRFEEFRATRFGRSRFPEPLWTAAAEVAKRYGVNRTARVLRLEYGGLRKRVENQARPKAKSKHSEPPGLLEFIAPGAKPVTNCTVEVESAQGGKLRLELKCVVNRHHFQLPCTEWVRRSGSDCDGCSWLNRERAAHKFVCSAASLDRRYGSGLSDIVRPALMAY